jgi:adenosine deaminase
MCPLSNVRTGVVADIISHPIADFIKQGMLVTINTDDPKMFNNTLVDEYTQLMEHFHFPPATICQLIDNAVTASWLSDDKKITLRATLQRHPSWVA